MRAIAEFLVPLKTTNPLNNSWGHWTTQSRKRKNERRAALASCPRLPLRPVLVVTFTRYSRGTLDDDGLRAALKTIRDAVAYRLGVDDRTQLVEWRYLQDHSDKPGVRVVIDRADVSTP